MSCVFRNPAPGDIGWNSNFEVLVARVAVDFLERNDTLHERCWIAVMNGRIVSSVFLMRGDGGEDKLRLLYVEPDARGQGIGEQLVSECIRAARELGYASIALWTTRNLHSARCNYERMGFVLESETEFEDSGPRLRGQYWCLTLD